MSDVFKIKSERERERLTRFRRVTVTTSVEGHRGLNWQRRDVKEDMKLVDASLGDGEERVR